MAKAVITVEGTDKLELLAVVRQYLDNAERLGLLPTSLYDKKGSCVGTVTVERAG